MPIKPQLSRPLFFVLGLASIVLVGTLFLREQARPPLQIATDEHHIVGTTEDVVLDIPSIVQTGPPTPELPETPAQNPPDVDIHDADYWRTGKFISSHLDSHPAFNAHGAHNPRFLACRLF